METKGWSPILGCLLGKGLGKLERNLLAPDRHVLRSFDPDPDRVVVDLQHRDSNPISHPKTLPKLPAQYQHDSLLSESRSHRRVHFTRQPVQRQGELSRLNAKQAA